MFATAWVLEEALVVVGRIRIPSHHILSVVSLAILHASFDALPVNALALEQGHVARGPALTLPRGVNLPQSADPVRLVLCQMLQLPPLLYHCPLRRPNPHPVPPLLNHLQRTLPLLLVVLR